MMFGGRGEGTGAAPATPAAVTKATMAASEPHVRLTLTTVVATRFRTGVECMSVADAVNGWGVGAVRRALQSCLRTGAMMGAGLSG